MTPQKVFEKEYPIGLVIYKWDDDKQYTITGNLVKEYRFKDFDGAYDAEEYLQSKINCKGIDFIFLINCINNCTFATEVS